MIKYNNSNISGWYFDTSDIIKVYRNNAVVYYKLITSGGTSGQTPCFAVIDDISQYQETEFEDVYNKADSKWYKLNNLNQYEEYGVYGSGRTITYYEGKLTIDGDYEYQYSGSSWVNVGEVSGVTASLPDVSFSLNYNAKQYDSTNRKIPQTSGQLQNVDAVCNYGYHIVDHSADGYISITGNSRFVCSGNNGTYLNRTNTQTGCTMTIVSKAKTNNGYSILTNRQGNGTTRLNWMYRQYADGYMKLHGQTDTQQIACSTTEPNILSVRTLYNGGVKSYMNNWSVSTSTSQTTFAYLNTGTLGGALFCDYSDVNNEFWQGDFYWVYMSQNVLTDEQIQQVINYNESSGGTVEYPIYYDEMQDPPNNLSFSSITEAEEYECPWVGMTADIVDTDYIFDENYDWVTKYQWVTVSGEYVCVGTDKYSKIEKQQRNVDDTWENLGVYSAGTLIESASTDCSIDYTKEYLTFEPISSAVTFAYKSATVNYSLDSGTTWNSITTSQTVTVNVGQKIMWKATLNTSSDNGSIRFASSGGTWKAYGNLLSMQSGDNFTATTTINSSTLHWLFYQCTDLVDIDNLKIPATSGGSNALRATFRGCGFSKVPSDLLLSITTIGNQGYMGTFEDCTNLTASPILPASSIPNYGYFAMFNNCSSLTACTCLATSNIGSNRTQLMLSGVSSTGTFYKHPNATWSSGQYGYPSTWTVVDYTG